MPASPVSPPLRASARFALLHLEMQRLFREPWLKNMSIGQLCFWHAASTFGMISEGTAAGARWFSLVVLVQVWGGTALLWLSSPAGLASQEENGLRDLLRASGHSSLAANLGRQAPRLLLMALFVLTTIPLVLLCYTGGGLTMAHILRCTGLVAAYLWLVSGAQALLAALAPTLFAYALGSAGLWGAWASVIRISPQSPDIHAVVLRILDGKPADPRLLPALALVGVALWIVQAMVFHWKYQHQEVAPDRVQRKRRAGGERPTPANFIESHESAALGWHTVRNLVVAVAGTVSLVWQTEEYFVAVGPLFTLLVMAAASIRSMHRLFVQDRLDGTVESLTLTPVDEDRVAEAKLVALDQDRRRWTELLAPLVMLGSMHVMLISLNEDFGAEGFIIVCMTLALALAFVETLTRLFQMKLLLRVLTIPAPLPRHVQTVLAYLFRGGVLWGVASMFMLLFSGGISPRHFEFVFLPLLLIPLWTIWKTATHLRSQIPFAWKQATVRESAMVYPRILIRPESIGRKALVRLQRRRPSQPD